MKKLSVILSFLSFFALTSCEEEVVLDFDKTEPRLVIEANIFVDEEVGRIKLSKTTDFYANVYPKIDDAEVQIRTIETNEINTFIYSGDGNYIGSNFYFEEGNHYELTVNYNNEIYKAMSTLLSSPEITNIEQIDDGGILGNSYEFRFYFQDDPETENYYLAQIISPTDHSFGVLSDEFTNGNLISDLYFYDKEDLEAGNTLQYSINSISKDYYNYLSKLLSISGTSSNPFASPTGTIKGNIVNQTNESNYALGYFHIAKRNHYNYTVE